MPLGRYLIHLAGEMDKGGLFLILIMNFLFLHLDSLTQV